jgi:hypothetical protein
MLRRKMRLPSAGRRKSANSTPLSSRLPNTIATDRVLMYDAMIQAAASFVCSVFDADLRRERRLSERRALDSYRAGNDSNVIAG